MTSYGSIDKLKYKKKGTVMTEQLKKPSGVLFNAKQKTNPNQPDKTGNVELDVDMVKLWLLKLKLTRSNINEHVKINLSCWKTYLNKASLYKR